jgi:4-diphosphocytidyl-2C-methyl-D-erythritol 2-phosphate synthase
MTAIDLADYVHIETMSDDDRITVKTDSGFLPCDQRNLTYQAAKKIKSHFGIETGLKISIKKIFRLLLEWGAVQRMQLQFYER